MTRAGSRCLLGLAPTGGYRATPVTGRAVGSYPTVSPLPLEKGRSVLCGPVRRLAAPRCYLAVCPVELGLSSTDHSCRPAATIPPCPHLPPVGKVEAARRRRKEPRQPYRCWTRRRRRRSRLSAGRGPAAVRGSVISASRGPTQKP